LLNELVDLLRDKIISVVEVFVFHVLLFHFFKQAEVRFVELAVVLLLKQGFLVQLSDFMLCLLHLSFL
jgi:hypothetical protein